jgi:hypothetical protein
LGVGGALLARVELVEVVLATQGVGVEAEGELERRLGLRDGAGRLLGLGQEQERRRLGAMGVDQCLEQGARLQVSASPLEDAPEAELGVEVRALGERGAVGALCRLGGVVVFVGLAEERERAGVVWL